MKKRSGIFTLLLSMILIFCFAVPISADLLELDQVEPAGFEDTTNPYGYKEGDPFPLLVQDELVFFGGSGGSHHTGLKNADSTDALNSFTNNPKSNSSDTSFGVPEGKFSFVQAVAFDADGDGTKNYMFFIGMRYYDNTYHAYGWVVDMASSDRKVLATYDIGDMSWVGDGYPQYASTSLFSITAGDYNGDKAETVVVSVPLNYNSEDYSGVELCEFKFDTANSTLSLLSISQRNLMSNRIYDPIDKSYSIDTGRNKLAVSLVTGDFGGDFIDDLAVLSYHHMMTESDMDIAYYDPVIYVVHGRTNGNYIVDGYADRIEYLQAKSGSTITFPMACTLVAGDWDNDNDDDLCVVGVTGSASFSGSKVSGNFLIDDKNWYVQRLYCDGYKLIKEGAKKVDANAWFEDGFYISDMIYGRVMAEAFALNGETNPDMLFISGSLFDISGNDVVYKGQSSYFDSGDEGLSSHTATNTFMQSTTVGNFTGDPAGREQVFYVVGMKRSGHSSYYYKCGYVSGKDFNDTDTAYGLAGGYHFSDVDDDSSYIYKDELSAAGTGLNCIVAAVDSDTDSVYAKYLGKQYAYSDPTVSVVLQAAPYFSEVSGAGSNWTEYKISTIYGSGEIGSESLGASLGLSGSVGFPGIVNVQATLEYACNKTTSWEESVTTSTSNSFVATSYDTVVVNRIPVFIYQYDLLDADNHWYGGPQMELMSPRPAVYESLSVDEYNDFARSYNSKMKGANVDFEPLETINKTENYLDNNEGNPYAYNQHGWSEDGVNATQISLSAVSLGKNNALGRVSWTEENTRTDSWEVTEGFNFAFTSRFGPEIFGLGPSGTIDYRDGYGKTTTSGTAVGAECTVQDIDGPGLVAQGVPSSVVHRFGFDWTLGRWERHLSGSKDNRTPFIGYALSNVTSPPLSVKDLKAVTVDTDQIKLSWTKPQEQDGMPAIDGYYLYSVDAFGNYNRMSELIDKDATEYTVSDLDAFTEYSYVITTVDKVDHIEYESVWSNKATAATLRNEYQLTYSSDDDSIALDVRDFRGNIIENDDIVNAGTLVTFYAVSKDDHCVIEKLVITRKDSLRTDTIQPMADGSVAMCRFMMTGDVDVKVYTQRDTVVESEISFKAENTVGDVTVGTVNAQVNGVDYVGSTVVNDPVTFTAMPANGFVLKEWNVTVDSETTTVSAANNNPYVLNPVEDNYHVEAVFELADEDIRVVMLDCDETVGDIILSDEKGDAYVLSDRFNGILVPVGTKVTVTAEAKDGYRFVGWTRGAEGKEGDSFTVEVTDNMLIGANFEAIRHLVNYEITAGEEGGYIVPTPYVNSGDYVADGTELFFTTRAEDGYRIDKVTVVKGDAEKVYTFADEYKTMVSGSIVADANIDIKVEISSCVCEGYDDVTLTDWFHDAAVYAIDHELMTGVTETTFAPYDFATRAQIVTILYRMAGEPEVDETSPFSDVKADSWYGDAVTWAASVGIAKGMTDEIFAPNEYITREQMVTFFYRYSAVNGYSLAGGADLSRFPDADEISDYALETMDWAVAAGLIQGDNNGYILPQDKANRAQIATILERYMKTQVK